MVGFLGSTSHQISERCGAKMSVSTSQFPIKCTRAQIFSTSNELRIPDAADAQDRTPPETSGNRDIQSQNFRCATAVEDVPEASSGQPDQLFDRLLRAAVVRPGRADKGIGVFLLAGKREQLLLLQQR